MIKRILSVLLIAMLLALPAAQAEQNIHTPGQVSLAWFSDAFERGDIILMDMNFQLAMNENCTALFGEDAKFLGALSKVLPQTTLTLGAARLSDGIRLLFGGQYAANEQTAALDLLVDLTRDGLTVVSSSIPGERLTASWETLLLLYGVSAEQTAQILSLRDADLEAMMAELAAQLAPTLQIAAQIAVPYGEIILQHLGELPREILTDVPAKGVYPAAATEVCILITPKSLGDLFTALANQLENDTTLCAILDAYLAQSGESITTTQLCQAVKASAAESMTDESTPLHVYIGMDEAENFLYTMINSFEEIGRASCRERV